MADNSKFPNKENDLLKQFEAAVKTIKPYNNQADKPSNLVSEINANIHVCGWPGHTDVQHVDNHVDIVKQSATCKLK